MGKCDGILASLSIAPIDQQKTWDNLVKNITQRPFLELRVSALIGHLFALVPPFAPLKDITELAGHDVDRRNHY